MSIELDATDRLLIDALRENGRVTNKVLAHRLGIAETTVASRLRQLTQDKVLLVTLRRDLYSKGFDLQCFADVWVAGRRIEAVAKDLAAIDVVSAVTLMLGSPEIVVTFNAVDRADLLARLENEIAVVRGIRRIELHTAVDIRKYQAGYADLSGLE